jgi:hypothetical protein
MQSLSKEPGTPELLTLCVTAVGKGEEASDASRVRRAVFTPPLV